MEGVFNFKKRKTNNQSCD